MKHLIDLALEIIEGIERMFFMLCRKRHHSSLIADNIYWCTNSTWMERLVAYKQLELWTLNR